jgi:hypothetical protein
MPLQNVVIAEIEIENREKKGRLEWSLDIIKSSLPDLFRFTKEIIRRLENLQEN